MAPRLPSEVDAVTGDLLLMLDRQLPGRVEGFYLVGSVALGDSRPGQSDIDFIAVPAPGTNPAPLPALHADLARRYRGLDCDGIYLTSAELARPPAGTGPVARAGSVAMASADERHPVTWLTLAEHGISRRGPEPTSDWIAADRAAAIAYSRENLLAYWHPWLKRRRRLLSPEGFALLGDWATVWAALGVARLHAMIAGGLVLSKAGAGHHALDAFPHHAAILVEALNLRAGGRSGYRSPLSRRRDLIAFTEEVIGFDVSPRSSAGSDPRTSASSP